MSDAVKLVCFDWGGVILRHCRSWSEGVAAAGLPVRAGTDAPEWTARRRPLAQAFQVGALDEAGFLGEMHATMQGHYTIDELRRIHDAWLLGEYPGVRRVIERLVRQPSVRTALLSNTNSAHWARHLPKHNGDAPDFPTAGLLEHRHASHLMRLAKPGAEIYRAFEAATNARGGDILFFDDLPDNIASARDAGWRTVLIDHTGDTAAQIEAALREHRVLNASV